MFVHMHTLILIILTFWISEVHPSAASWWPLTNCWFGSCDREIVPDVDSITLNPDDTCTICLDNFEKGEDGRDVYAKLLCGSNPNEASTAGHLLHVDCANRWISMESERNRRRACPMCNHQSHGDSSSKEYKINIRQPEPEPEPQPLDHDHDLPPPPPPVPEAESDGSDQDQEQEQEHMDMERALRESLVSEARRKQSNERRAFGELEQGVRKSLKAEFVKQRKEMLEKRLLDVQPMIRKRDLQRRLEAVGRTKELEIKEKEQRQRITEEFLREQSAIFFKEKAQKMRIIEGRPIPIPRTHPLHTALTGTGTGTGVRRSNLDPSKLSVERVKCEEREQRKDGTGCRSPKWPVN